MAALTGARAAVEAALASMLSCRRRSRPLGPLPAGEDAVRVLLRAPLRGGARLAAALAAMRAVRSARKEAARCGPGRTRLTPSA